MTNDRNVDTSEKLSRLAAAYWDFFLDEHPDTARKCGSQDDSRVFFKESADDHDRRRVRCEEILREAKKLGCEPIDRPDVITLQLLVRELNDTVSSHDLQEHLRPMWFPFGPDMALSYAMQTESLGNSNEAEAYIERLRSIPGFLDDCLQRIQTGAEQGFRLPAVLKEPILENVKSHLKDPKDRRASWFAPLSRVRDARSAANEQRFDAIETIARAEILPALSQFAGSLEKLFSVHQRDSISCLDDPGGDSLYAHLVRHHTTLDLSPDEIHEIGLMEVANTTSEMRRLAKDSKHHDSIEEMRAYLRSDSQFVAASKQELLAQFEQLSKKIDRRIPEFFSRIPRMTYGVECMPVDIAAQMPSAYAQPNPGNRSLAGIHWISSLPDRCPSHMHIPLALHEAWPGHLMHIALLQEDQTLPAFRRYGYMNYTSLLEGWALYCERLGLDLGLYENEYQHLGRLEMDIWRSVRLVVDTGIHAKSWSRDQAVDYMRRNASLALPVIESEVDRYIGMPGQALAYKLGERCISRLRGQAERTLGKEFSLRDFHDCILDAGAVTLPLLQQCVEDWLLSSRTAVEQHPSSACA